MEVETGFEPVYAALQAAASPLGHSTAAVQRPQPYPRLPHRAGVHSGDAGGPLTQRADDGTRTRDPHLGKVMRYQLRYVRMPRQRVAQRGATVSDPMSASRGCPRPGVGPKDSAPSPHNHVFGIP